jgi:hypothetical protein
LLPARRIGFVASFREPDTARLSHSIISHATDAAAQHGPHRSRFTHLHALGTGHWALGTGHWALGTGHWALGTST